ncbi:addiction module protein [Marinicella gelatinilytica]|uniref:addiction module protein n=1 Tax=Marinicella gelatinilytica TaxID=2996017 RepID=UPI00226092C1|nr:addiction module protein [Marinicella gelatinilytica]MCX7545223.1 addiction module protein [Marinicella gelatinilytica]
MSRENLLKQIDQLALSEKISMVEDLWDSIACDANKLPMPEWQKRELDRRQRDFQNGEVKLHDWKSAHQKLRTKG